MGMLGRALYKFGKKKRSQWIEQTTGQEETVKLGEIKSKDAE
jgi:hypothetical protein